MTINIFSFKEKCFSAAGKLALLVAQVPVLHWKPSSDAPPSKSSTAGNFFFPCLMDTAHLPAAFEIPTKDQER